MLIFGLKRGQSFFIDTSDGVIEIVVTDIERGKVRVGTRAPREIVVHRRENWERYLEAKRKESGGSEG